MCLEEVEGTNHVHITVVHNVPAKDETLKLMALLASFEQCQGRL